MEHPTVDELRSLHESNRQLRGLVNEIEYALMVFDSQGLILDLNDALCRIVGLPRDELLGHPIQKISCLSTPERFQAVFQRALAESPATFEAEYLLNDGTWIPAEVTAKVITGDHGPRLLVVGRDMRNQKKTESDLRASEYFLRESQRVGHIGSFTLDVKTGTWHRSKNLNDILGIDDTFVADTAGWLSLVHPDDAGGLVQFMTQQAADHKRHVPVDYRIVRWSDKAVRFLSSTIEMSYNDRGELTSFLGTTQDVTEKRQAEEAVQRAQRLESLGILAGGLAHDFNNLLSGIFGFIDLATLRSTEEEVIRCLSKTRGSLDRARALTRQLLTFAKGGTPVMAVQPLVPVVEQAVHFALSGSKVVAQVRLEGLWLCRFDQNQIGQVVDNLVINAVQAMDSGGNLVVSATNEVVDQSGTLPPGRYVKLSFSDQGCGIPPHLLPLIFDPFFTTKPGGHGLGLATCHSVIKRHGGAIEVESEPGRGSTFHVWLPAHDLAPDPASGVPVEPAPEEHRGRGRFLVMDDEPLVQETLGTTLTEFGYTVEVFSDGRTALEALALTDGHDWVAMILDLTVPGGLGGQAAVGEIRRRLPQVPIFVSSGYSDDPVMAAPQDYGFTASLGKPFERHELARFLNRHLKNHAGE